ncbi:MAG: ABC transporter substrate-binding protein [Azospirillaceae bacterium]|nr:ABC transporter substrate-binding protein [Azospirillaceae bacterium]
MTSSKTILSALFGASALSVVLAMPAAAEDVVRLGNLKLAHYGAVSYTQVLTDCGIKVEERIFAKGPDIMQAIMAGELDVGATASEAAISGRASGAPIYIVAGFAKGGARLVASPDAKVAKVADLKGKKVGVTRGGIQEVLLAAELAQNNLTWSDQPGKDVQIVYLNYPDLNQALMLKQLDAIMQTEPQGSQAVNGGFGVEVVKPYDTAIGTPVRTLVMSEDFHDKHKAVAEKFMRCFVKATKTFIDSPATASKYVRETLFKKQLTEADFDSAMGNAQYSYDIDPAQIQVTGETMSKYGVSKLAKVPTATDYVKLDLLADAKKDLGIK